MEKETGVSRICVNVVPTCRDRPDDLRMDKREGRTKFGFTSLWGVPKETSLLLAGSSDLDGFHTSVCWGRFVDLGILEEITISSTFLAWLAFGSEISVRVFSKILGDLQTEVDPVSQLTSNS